MDDSAPTPVHWKTTYENRVQKMDFDSVKAEIKNLVYHIKDASDIATGETLKWKLAFSESWLKELDRNMGRG